MECSDCDLGYDHIPFTRTTIIDGKTSTVTHQDWVPAPPAPSTASAASATSKSSTPRSTSVESTTASGGPSTSKPTSSIAGYTSSSYSTIPQLTTSTPITNFTSSISTTYLTNSTEISSLTTTQTTLPSQSPHSSPHSHDLPEAAKAMIGIGAGSAVILAGFLSWLYLRHKKRQKAARQRKSDPFPWLAGLPEGDDDRLRKPYEFQVLSPRIKPPVELGLDGQKYELPASRTWRISRRHELNIFF